MTPMHFLALQQAVDILEARERAQLAEITRLCDARRLLPHRAMTAVQRHGHEAYLGRAISAALHDLADIITARLEAAEQVKAEPLAHVTRQPGTRH